MTTTKPIKLPGNWFEGYALDIHTVRSIFKGHDEYGHEVFETQRSEIGELLYQLKYKSDRSKVNEIVSVSVGFLVRHWQGNKNIEAIIPVPPSKSRTFQPVIQLAKGIGCVSNELNRPKKREGWGMYIPHPSLFFGEPPTEMKCTQRY
jgi:predicted amidophosphoribosyltransferase